MSHHDVLHCFSLDGMDIAINPVTMIASRISRESASYLHGEQSRKAFDALSDKAGAELESLCFKGRKTEDQENNLRPLPCDDSEGKSSVHTGQDDCIDCIALFVTQNCNLRCVYCYGGAGEYGNPGVMDETTALRAVDWLIERCGPVEGRISFFGGEPFLNFPLMKKVAGYARQQAEKRGIRMQFTVTTNLTLLDREKLDFIRDFDVMTIASFDGPKELFDTLRPSADGSSSYDKAIKMIPELLAERGDKVNARATLMPGSDPAEVQSEINSRGFLRSHLIPAARSLYSGIEKRDDDTAYLEKPLALLSLNIRRFLDALNKRKEAQIMSLARSLEISLPARDAFLSRERIFLGRRNYKCGIGRSYAAVSITGEIYPCHRFAGLEKYRIGSIFENEILNADYRLSPVDVAEECRTCWTRYMCGGGCLHEHAGETGDIRIPSVRHCDYEKRRNEMKIALWCSISRDDYQWLEDCRVVSAKACTLDFG